jgi:hypothetical protein
MECDFETWLGVVVACIFVGLAEGQAVLEDVVDCLSLSAI